MATKRDYYEVLGVGRNASADEIRKSYRRLALEHHPDRNPGNAEAESRFKELSEAYEVLSDDEKRKRYDQFGHDGLRSTFGPGGFDFSRDFTHFNDIQDILGSLFGGSGSIFEELFGGRRRSDSGGSQQGTDLRFDIEIDFEEAAFGSVREITLPMGEDCETCKGSGLAAGAKPEGCKQCGGRGVVIASSGFFQVRQTCPVCGGSGEVITHPCRACRGTGRSKVQRRLTLRIPKGVATGSRLRLAGKGERGYRGGGAGDLYVVVHVRPHQLFERHDDDLFCEVPIPFDVAVLGGEIDVATVDGSARLKIAPGTESGKIFRLRGRGMESAEGRGRGDLHIKVTVEVPVGLNSKQKKILKDFVDASSEDNYPLAREFKVRGKTFLTRKEDLGRQANGNTG